MYYYDISERVVYIKSFSKTLLPGLRIAAVVLPKLLRNTFGEYKRWMDLNTSVLSQGALEIYIKSGMIHSNRKQIQKIYSERMSTLKQVSKNNKISQINWHIPYTGFYASIEFLDKINIDWLIKECDNKSISISNMKGYYLKDYFSIDILKFSVGSAETDDIKKGVENILKIIKTH